MARKLASIRIVDGIAPIEGADFIEAATVGGWKVIVKKGEYQPGDKAVYVEIDSFVPHDIAPYLTQRNASPKEYVTDGRTILGQRLKTAKMRGFISQGLLLKPSDFGLEGAALGDDVTAKLGIVKWEPPLPSGTGGITRGPLPGFIQKTDQERIQNLFDEMRGRADSWEVTVKLDGTSCTIFRHEGELRAAGRNWEFVVSEENRDNVMARMAMKYGAGVPDGYAVQGEVIGPGIQGNRDKLGEVDLYVFDVIEIAKSRKLLPAARREMIAGTQFKHVPVLDEDARMPASVDEILRLAEGKSIHSAVREGVVWKNNVEPDVSFKAISNKFLLKYDGS